MATLLQQLGAALGFGNSEAQASTSLAPTGTVNTAFSLDIHHTGTSDEQLLIAAQRDATMLAPSDMRVVMIGGLGNDHLTGGTQADLLMGGQGTNVMSGGDGADIFGHSTGATDVITDFSPAANERIALQQGMTLTGTTHGIVNPATFGLTGSPDQAVTMTFSDGSHIVLLHSSDTPDASWFI